MKRPNVLLLYTDQQRADALRCAGNPHIHTPNLDRLAERGVLMSRAFVNSPVCMPSRQSMLSGQYPCALGCAINGVEMPPDVPTVHAVLSPYGYATVNIGKLHFKNHSNRDHRDPHPSYGFDTLILSDEPGCYDDAYIKWVAAHDPSQVQRCRVSSPPACVGRRIETHGRDVVTPYVFEGPEELTHSAFVADETIEALRRHRNERFFCIAGFYAPHAPLNPPQRFVDLYADAMDRLPLPVMNPGEDARNLGDAQWRKIKAYYYALVSHVDDQVGRILDELDALGLADDTLVIFTSDHGEHLGDHGQVQKGPPGLDSCLHVPLIVSWPGRLPAGARFDELIEAVDIAPTILDCCGVQSPRTMQGRSFLPLLAGGNYQPRSSVYMEYKDPFVMSWRTVRSTRWKYGVRSDGQELLLDLQRDPHELRNVADDPAAQAGLHQMRRELIQRVFDAERQGPLRTAAY